MAIIYTYPTKATPNANDLILISDSQDSNKTKQVTVTSIKDAIDVVDSITATSPLATSGSTGAVTLSIPAATSGVNGYLASSDWSTFNGKQEELQSGVNIKTMNSNSILGSGDLTIDTTIDTKNDATSVANPTTSLSFTTGLTAFGAPGGAVSISFSGGLNNLSDVSFTGNNDSSMYIGNGAPSGLIGTPNKTTAVGEGAGNGTTSGSSNTLIGTNAGIAVTTGSTNTLAGADSGNTLTIGAGNVILGAGADSNTNNVNAAIAVGKSAVVDTGAVAIGESASATGGGIALGRGASNTTANLALGSISYPLLNTTDTGDVNGLATGQTPAKFIEVQIGNDKYYMALYAQA